MVDTNKVRFASVWSNQIKSLLWPAPKTVKYSPYGQCYHKTWPCADHCTGNCTHCIAISSSHLIRAMSSLEPQKCDSWHWCVCMCMCVSLYFTRFFWRRHPQLRQVELNFISLFWPSLPNGIQAAYEDFDRDLVFLFKGNFLNISYVSSSWRVGAGLPCGPLQVQKRWTKENLAPARLLPGVQAWPQCGHWPPCELEQAIPSSDPNTLINEMRRWH
jgi:hypothetical protein